MIYLKPTKLINKHDISIVSFIYRKMDIRKLDEHGTAAVTAHSMAAYISCLPKQHFDKFSKKVRDECQLWLAKMFRLHIETFCLILHFT